MNEMYDDDSTGGSYWKGALFRSMVSEYAICYDTLGNRRLTCMFSGFIHACLCFFFFFLTFDFLPFLIAYR